MSTVSPLQQHTISFLLHSNRQLAEKRHVMCVVEKAGFEPRTLGTGAERATNCATALVAQYNYIIVIHHQQSHFFSWRCLALRYKVDLGLRYKLTYHGYTRYRGYACMLCWVLNSINLSGVCMYLHVCVCMFMYSHEIDIKLLSVEKCICVCMVPLFKCFIP